MVGRRVRHWSEGHGTVTRWEPLLAAMTDTLVRLDSGREMWFSSSELKPADGRGPLPSRKDAREKADAEGLTSLRRIRAQHVLEFDKPWPGAEHGKAIVGRAIDRAIKEVEMRSNKVCVRTAGGKVACGVEVRGGKGKLGGLAARRHESFFNDNDRANALVGYLDAALWSSVGDDEKPLDENYTTDDIAPEAIEEARKDVNNFLDENEKDPRRWSGAYDFDRIGHDFWLTRNRHGTGFWDREAPGTELGEIGKRLTDSAHVYRSSDAYVGDDGKVYLT